MPLSFKSAQDVFKDVLNLNMNSRGREMEAYISSCGHNPEFGSSERAETLRNQACEIALTNRLYAAVTSGSGGNGPVRGWNLREGS